MAPITPEALEMLLAGPALRPPPGVQPNFVNPPSLVSLDRTTVAIALGILTSCIALRVYTKKFIIKSLGREDWVAVASWVFLIVYTGFSLQTFKYWRGRHQWDIRLEDFSSGLQSFIVASVLYGITTTLVKASILLQYLAIFNVGSRRTLMWWSSWLLIWFLGLFYFALIWAAIFGCSPREKAWKPLIEGSCTNSLAINVCSSTVNMIADLFIILLPQRSIWRLNMSRSKKIKTSVLFLIGLLVLISSIIRTYYAIETLSSPDYAYEINLMWVWTFAEFFTSILCSCLPSLTRLVRQIIPAGKSSDARFEGRHLAGITHVDGATKGNGTRVDTPQILEKRMLSTKAHSPHEPMGHFSA